MYGKGQYSTFDIVALFLLTRARLQEWIARGFIVPSVEKSVSRGTRNIFSRNDLYLIAVFIHLLEHGMHRELAAKFIGLFRRRSLSETLEEGKKYLIWFWNPMRVLAGEEEDEESDDSPPVGTLAREIPSNIGVNRSAMLVLDLENIKDRVDQMLRG